MSNHHVLLVDGSSYVFRGYYALPPLHRYSDGMPVNAVLGFCQMIWRMLQQARNADPSVRPSHIVVVFDYSRKTFRTLLHPEYKANRSAPPTELAVQFKLARQATRAFELPCIEMEGYEADDIIATYARLAHPYGTTTVVSPDKDLMQLVNDRVSLFDPVRERRYGVNEVFDKWGVRPNQMVDLQAMTGDTVDNVPGIPGIGAKTAAALLAQFGDLETIISRAEEIKQPARRFAITSHAAQARLSRELVRLKTDVEVPATLDELSLDPFDGAALLEFLRLMEFSSLTRRVEEALRQ